MSYTAIQRQPRERLIQRGVTLPMVIILSFLKGCGGLAKASPAQNEPGELGQNKARTCHEC